MEIFKDMWEQSYARNENYIFFPKEEVVKFLNRFVRKKIGLNQFIDKLDFSQTVRGLDMGCGIGSNTLLMGEFGLEAYGVDISANAIHAAQEIARATNREHVASRFCVVEGDRMPFPDGYFDITICDSVLDSMSFSLAQQNTKEISRVTKKYAFLTIISGDDSEHFREYDGEEIVSGTHENGTVQSYFNFEKIKRLILDTNFKIVWCHLVQDLSLLDANVGSRYFLVLEKE